MILHHTYLLDESYIGPIFPIQLISDSLATGGRFTSGQPFPRDTEENI